MAKEIRYTLGKASWDVVGRENGRVWGRMVNGQSLAPWVWPTSGPQPSRPPASGPLSGVLLISA